MLSIGQLIGQKEKKSWSWIAMSQLLQSRNIMKQCALILELEGEELVLSFQLDLHLQPSMHNFLHKERCLIVVTFSS